MLNVPAATAAPVPPAQTSASARPSATALAASTIEASGLARTACAGSRGLGDRDGRVDDLDARARLPELAGGAEQDHPRAPGGRQGGARRRPRPARGRRRCSRRPPPARRLTCRLPAGARTQPPVSLPASRGRDRGRARASGRDDLTSRIGAADRADPVRAPRAVALRAAFSRGGMILCWARRLAVRLWICFFLGTAMRPRRVTARGPAPDPRPALFQLQLAQLRPARVGRLIVAVLGPGLVEVGRADRAQPRQSSRQSTLAGIASANASRAQAARSSTSLLT